MDTYTEVHNIQEWVEILYLFWKSGINFKFSSETTAIFDSLESNWCVDIVRARWDLQVHRYGQKLSECLLNSVNEVYAWNDYVNTVHHSTQATTNQVQNAGVATLSELDAYLERDSLHEHVNNRFRRLLLAASPYLDSFEEFRASVVDNEEQIIDELTQVRHRFKI